MESPRPLAATYRSGIAKCMAVAVKDGNGSDLHKYGFGYLG